MLIDEPEQSREIMTLAGARPTHPGAESLFTRLSADVDDDAAEAGRVYAPLWDCFVAERRAMDEEGFASTERARGRAT